MPSYNQINANLTDQNVTDILGHLTAIQALLPFLISRQPGDNNVMLGDKTMAFDEKCAGYMVSHPEFLPNYVGIIELVTDRTARAQIQKFLPQLRLLTAQAVDTYDVIGNEIMMADLAYYSNTADGAKRGHLAAADIHTDLATRYPGRPSKAAAAKTKQTP